MRSFLHSSSVGGAISSEQVVGVHSGQLSRAELLQREPSAVQHRSCPSHGTISWDS